MTPEDLPEDPSADEFVRSDIAVAIAFTLVAAVASAFVLRDWRVLAISLAFSYMAVGISTMWEWNKRLQTQGFADYSTLRHTTASGFIPIVIVFVVLILSGVSFTIAAPSTIGVLLVYEYTLYAIARRGLGEKLYFRSDPFDHEDRAYTESVYIDRLERRSLQKAESNRD